jgi:hypothetical protein
MVFSTVLSVVSAFVAIISAWIAAWQLRLARRLAANAALRGRETDARLRSVQEELIRLRADGASRQSEETRDLVVDILAQASLLAEAQRRLHIALANHAFHAGVIDGLRSATGVGGSSGLTDDAQKARHGVVRMKEDYRRAHDVLLTLLTRINDHACIEKLERLSGILDALGRKVETTRTFIGRNSRIRKEVEVLRGEIRVLIEEIRVLIAER